MTPAAVGQLVRGLEDWLGVALFVRASTGRSRLAATEAAQRALPEIRAGFDRLGMGLEHLKNSGAHGVLTVTVSPAFAAKWLLPRIERFHAAWPEIDLRLDTNLKAVDFVPGGIDIGVRYGIGKWDGLLAEKLMNEEIYPVCSPGWLARHGRLPTPAQLADETLIHDLSMDGQAGFPTWDRWLEAAGTGAVATQRGMRINNSAAVLQAAIDGSGVALGRSVMARDDLAAGRLVRLFPHIAFPSSLAYYVVYRPGCATLARLAAFRQWLVDEAALDRPT